MEPLTDLREDLVQKKQEERTLSRRRQQLHRRIEFVRGTGAMDPTAPETRRALELEEAEVSALRRQLHREIDQMREGLARECRVN